MKPLMVDLFCGRGGWTKGFLKMGWRVRGYDLNPQPDYPKEAEFVQMDALDMTARDLVDADFACCSSPCEQFSVHCMKHFHPNPKFPEMGIRLFEHSRELLKGLPHIMENVRCAEKFVGKAVNHCGPFYFWGNAVPAVIPAELYRVTKGMKIGGGAEALRIKQTLGKEALREYRREHDILWSSSKSKARQEYTAKFAEIPPAIAEYFAQTAKRIVAAAQHGA